MIHFVGPESMNSRFPRVSAQYVLDYFSGVDEMQVDTETEGRDCRRKKIVALQLGDRENQFVIDARYTSPRVFKPLLESKRCLLHNAKFDYKFLKAEGIIIEHIYDTMLAEAVVFNGYVDWGYSLQAVAKRHVGVFLDKETRGDFHKIRDKAFTDAQIQYAGSDVMYLQDIRDKQKVYIDKYDLQIAVDDENEAVKALGDIEYNGMILDVDAWMEVAQQNEQEALDREIELDEYLIEMDTGYHPTGEQDLFGAKKRKLAINYGSPLQALDMLRKAGLPVNSTSAFALEQFKDIKLVQLFTGVREANKKISTYGRSFLNYINPATGRVHTEFWQIKDTFRLGSGNKMSNSPNVQNIPRDNKYRNCFVAPKGYKWVSLDYSGQELRLMADFSNERKLIDAVNVGKDLHCFVGAMMYGKEIAKDDPLRDEAKTINFGKPYGMGAYKLASKLNITEEQAEAKLRMHEQAFPDLDRWLKKAAAFGKSSGYILTNPIHKGRRWFPELKQARELRLSQMQDWSKIYSIEGSVERKSMNTPIQGTGAIIMKRALSATREILKHYDAKLICTVHDQLDIEVREDQAEEVYRKVGEVMEAVGNVFVKHVTMPVDGKITDFWTKG